MKAIIGLVMIVLGVAIPLITYRVTKPEPKSKCSECEELDDEGGGGACFIMTLGAVLLTLYLAILGLAAVVDYIGALP